MGIALSHMETCRNCNLFLRMTLHKSLLSVGLLLLIGNGLSKTSPKTDHGDMVIVGDMIFTKEQWAEINANNQEPITITGKILLPTDKDVTFPEGSFLFVSCFDTSTIDGSGDSVTFDTFEIDVSNKSSKDDLPYGLKVNLPNRGFKLSVSAKINMGWKPNGWGIRKGDYTNEYEHDIKVKEGVTNYEEDIEVVQI